MITPLSTRPTPPPTPNTELTVPTPRPIFSGGNSSRMMPKESGKTAAPKPWITRQKMSDSRLHAAAAPSDARPKIPSEMTSIRFLP